MSKPIICSRCASGDHADCVGSYGNWAKVLGPPRWWQRRRKTLGPEWTCICRHGEANR